MPGNPKFLIGEKDGVEFGGATEYVPFAEDILVDDSSLPYSASNVQEALENGTTDHHSGWFFIQTGTVVNVDEYKQMRVKGTLTVEGAINITGMLVLD